MVTAPRRLPSTSQFEENENRFARPSFDSLSLKGRIKCHKMDTGSVLKQSSMHPVCTMHKTVWNRYLHSTTNWHTENNNILPIVITRTYLYQFWHMFTYMTLCGMRFVIAIGHLWLLQICLSCNVHWPNHNFPKIYNLCRSHMETSEQAKKIHRYLLVP